MNKMMEFDPQKRPTAAECLEHEYFKDFVPPVQTSVYGKSNKSFFNKSNEINSGVRKPSAVSKRLESRKSKLGSSHINKDSFYKTKNKIQSKVPIRSPPNSYFNNPSKAGLGVNYGGISSYLKNRNKMNSRENNRKIPSGKTKPMLKKQDSNPESILHKYSNNNQGMSGAQNYQPGGLSKNRPSEGYGLYNKAKGGGLGGYGKIARKDSSKIADKPPAYGNYNYGGGGISKYLAKRKGEQDPNKLPNVTNRQALGSGASIGSRRNVGSGLGSKGSNRSHIPSGGGLGRYGSGQRAREKESELPKLNKFSKPGGLGGIGKVGGLGGVGKVGGLSKGGLGVLGGGGLGKGGGLGRHNL